MHEGSSSTSPRVKLRATRWPGGCVGCPVMSQTEWSILNPAEMRLLERTSLRCLRRRGEAVFHQSDDPQGIYCIRNGKLLLTQMDSFGGETAFCVVGPGETVGHRSFFSEKPHSATARALEACRLCFIPRATLKHLLASNRALAIRFLRTIARDKGPLEAPLLRGSWLPVNVRVANLLLVLRKRFAVVDSDESFRLDLPLSRQDIAAMIGARPETVARAIRSLHAEGLASFQGRQVVVSNIQRLFDLVRDPRRR